jgi:hypothetical protein
LARADRLLWVWLSRFWSGWRSALAIVNQGQHGADLPAPNEGAVVAIPAGLKQRHVANMIDFLQRLKKVRIAPVFVFTNESVEDVESELKKHPDLYDETDPSHILVSGHGSNAARPRADGEEQESLFAERLDSGDATTKLKSDRKTWFSWGDRVTAISRQQQ